MACILQAASTHSKGVLQEYGWNTYSRAWSTEGASMALSSRRSTQGITNIVKITLLHVIQSVIAFTLQQIEALDFCQSSTPGKTIA